MVPAAAHPPRTASIYTSSLSSGHILKPAPPMGAASAGTESFMPSTVVEGSGSLTSCRAVMLSVTAARAS